MKSKKYRNSFIPQYPHRHLPLYVRVARISHIGLYVAVAFFIGIGFAEGLLSFTNQGYKAISSFGSSESLVASTTALKTSYADELGSDDKEEFLPVSEYNVIGKPGFIDADAYMIGDVETGEVVIEKSINKIYPIASVSKLITALVAETFIPYKQEVIVSKSALATYGASGGLVPGEKVKAGDLIYPLLLESSNDVAQLISEQLPEGEFVKRMNELSKTLAMNNSSFEEASGLSPKNISTAEDLFLLARYIYKESPHLLDVARIRQFSLLRHTWTNHNYFLKYDTFVGGKNGYTDEARRTTLSIFELPVKRGETVEKRTLAIILLHTDTREQDVVRLLDFIKKSVVLSE